MRTLANFIPVFVLAAALDTNGILTIAIAVFTAMVTLLGVHYTTKYQAKKAAQDASKQALSSINTGFNNLVQRLQADNAVMRGQMAENQKTIAALQQSNADLQTKLALATNQISQLTEDLAEARSQLTNLRQTNNDLIVELTKTQAKLSQK